MFELLYQILHQNWRYFFKTSVLTTVQKGAAEDTMENEPQFTAAMQVGLCFYLQMLSLHFLELESYGFFLYIFVTIFQLAFNAPVPNIFFFGHC